MSVKAGDIVIELNLDNDGFTARVKDSGRILRQLQGDFSKTATSVKRMEEQTTSLSTRFRHLVMTIGNLRFVAMDINDIFLRLPAAILKTAGEMERLEKTMTGLSTKFTETARAAEGAANFKFVTDMAKRAPFEIGAIADAFIKFKTGGIDPTNGSLQALTDSVAKFGGNSESLKRASVAIQQMLGKGVVSMEELRQQLGEAVPTAMRDMADGMGVSMSKLASMIKTGTVQAEGAIGKMLLRMKINNAGAAESMMETWVGSMARLKTEWSLTAKFISEQSGFGDAAKHALDAITSGMASDDFKRFAVSFGGTLKEAIEAFVSFSRVIIENREAIKLAVEAFVLYKAGTAIIYPALKTMEAGMKSKTTAMMEGIAATRLSIESDRARVVQEATNSLYAVERRQQELAAKLAADREELASVRARNAAIIAEDARMNAQLAALRMAERTTGVNNIGSQQSTLRYMDELSRKNSELVARERELAAAVSAGTVATNAANAAVAQKTTALAQLSGTQATASRAAVALGAAMNGVRAAFWALGGPIGMITIALLAGIEMWNRYGRTAEENAARAKRAALGLSTAEDVAKQKKKVADLQTELKAIDAEMANTVVGQSGPRGGAVFSQAERDAQVAAKQDLAKRLVEAQKVLTQAEVAVMESSGRELASVSERATQVRVRDIEKAAATERMARLKKFSDDTKDMDKNSKAYQALEQKQVQLDAAAFQATQAKKLAILKEEFKKEGEVIARGANTPEGEASLQRSKQLEEQMKALQTTMASDAKMLASTVPTVKGDDEKGPKDNPIQRLIKQLKEDNAGLSVEIEGLGKTLGAADKVKAKFAEIDQAFKNGDYDGKGKNGVKATPADVKALKELERTKLYNEQLIKDSQDFTQKMDGLGPRYAEAMEVLADPLGLNKKGAELRKVDDYFSKIAEDRLRAVAAVQGMDTEGLKAKMRGMAAAIDTMPTFDKMASQTKELNESIVADTREAALARQKAADETYRNFAQNEIDKVRAAAAGNTEIIRQADMMQQILADNMAARSRSNQEKFKTPMERMRSEWENTTRNMEEATTRWSEQSIDALVEVARTGKFEFGGLVKSILADILKIQLKKNMGGAMSTIMDLAVKALGGGTSPNASGGANTGGFGSGTGFGNQDMGQNFANGGIMTQWGSVPLRKYAAGGIANSPQMAIYGEGSQNEAFVPLPDGRRIPVNLQGGGGMPGVTVNVINQSGQPVAAQQGQSRFDGKQMVLDVVLSAANQPGPFRDGMKNAMS